MRAERARRPIARPGPGAHVASQRGVALTVALLVLVVLTVLGVSSLGTTVLEGRMAVNLQEKIRAFQTAEIGVVRALADPGTYRTADTHGNNETEFEVDDGSGGAYRREYLGSTSARRTRDTAHGHAVNFYHFDIESEGATPTEAHSMINQGVYQIGAGASGILFE